MTSFYNADIVSVDGSLFESMNCALEYITQNYRDWCNIDYMETALTEVEYNDGYVVVKYVLVEEDFADDPHREEYFEVKYKEMTTIVPDYRGILSKI